MTEKIAFNYKRVTKGDINDHVFDNYDNEYIYLKRDNSIIIFKKLSDDICYYFDKNGVMLNNTDVFLHIEHSCLAFCQDQIVKDLLMQIVKPKVHSY